MESREETIGKTSVGDQPTQEDALGFEPYVTAIAEFLTNSATKPPLTLSIEGEWGSGKSSFMKQLKKAIEEIPEKELNKELNNISSDGMFGFFKKSRLSFKKLKPQPKVVWFNAWRHDKAEALWATFALEFIQQISRPSRNFRNLFSVLIGNIKLFLFRFDWSNGLQKITLLVLGLFVVLTLGILVYDKAAELYQKGTDLYNIFQTISQDKTNQDFLRWLAGVVGVIISVTGFISLLLQLKNSVVGDPKNDLTNYLRSPNYRSQVSFVEKFHKDFQKIVEAYAGKNKVYVFIDDLDRCEVPKSADLMQAINLMISNDPQLIFILGMDREKVAAGIAFKYEQIIPYLYANNKTNEDSSLQGMEYAYSFMEKFIQLPFLVPKPANDNLEPFLDEIFSNSAQQTSLNSGFSRNIPAFIKQIPILSCLFRAKSSNSNNDVGETTQNQIAETKKEQIQSRIEKIKIKEGQESQTVRNIIIMVAPALDDNPRRLKQFINVFRLKTFIAASTGLLDELLDNDNRTQESGLTLEQLGKFTAISLKWPRLLVDLNVDPQLLKKLYLAQLSTVPDNESENDYEYDDKNNYKYDYITSYWSGHQKLIDLLCYGCEPSQSEQRDDKYSLENVNVDKLLQISPRVAFRGVDLPSEKSVDYTRLEQLLAAKQWKEADEETYRVMCLVVGRSYGDWIRPEELLDFPCADLRTIDNLWVKYSDRQFGFSVQKEIYLELGGIPDAYLPTVWEKFGEKVGWKMNGRWILLSEVKYNTLVAPIGHLPVRWGFSRFDLVMRTGSSLASRLVNCNI